MLLKLSMVALSSKGKYQHAAMAKTLGVFSVIVRYSN